MFVVKSFPGLLALLERLTDFDFRWVIRLQLPAPFPEISDYCLQNNKRFSSKRDRQIHQQKTSD